MSVKTCRQHNPFLLLIDMPAPAADDAAGSNMLGFFDRSKAAWESELGNWAERPYILAVAKGSGALPTPAQAAVIATEMDKNHETDIAVLVPRGERAGCGPALAFGVTQVDPRSALLVTGMLIRPLYGKRPASCAVFGI